MNPFENQMPNLAAMYGNWNPMAYLKGMQQEDNAAAFNQELAVQNQEKTKQTKQATSLADLMNPLKVQEKTLGNATTLAQLPGVVANSEKAGLDTKMAKDSYTSKLDDMIKGYQFKNKERELAQLEMGGRAYMQAEPMLASVPPPARHAAAKRLLGEFYQPEFDQVPPEKLGQVLNFVGSEMMQSQQKLYQASQIADKKGDVALQINDKRIQSQKELAAYKAALAEKTAAAKKSGDPKTYQAAATELLKAAAAEDDPERKMELVQQAQQFVDLNQAAMVARGQAGQTGKVDTGAVTGLPTMPGPQTPQVTVPGMAPKSPPIENNPATKKNGAIKSLSDLQAIYPGVPPEKLREAYKKKFGVDIQ